MEWCRLYARLRHDPAVQDLPDSAFRLFVESLCYATEAESDGHIPARQLPKFGRPGSTRNAAALVGARLWTDIGDDGWTITKWQALQEDLETVRKRRKRDADRKAEKRAAKVAQNSRVQGGLHQGLHGGVPVGVLVEIEERREEPTHLTENVASGDARERDHSPAGSIAAAYAAGVPLSDHGRALRVIAAALGAGYAPDLIRRGIGVLIAEQRTCTPDTLRIAMHGTPVGAAEQHRRRTATEKASQWLTVGTGEDPPPLRALPGGLA